jgi:membrane protein
LLTLVTKSKQSLQAFAQSTLVKFFAYFFRRLKNEQIQVIAGYLSYVTLMSLVPLIVVMLSVLTAFPIFSEIRETIENFVYSNFVPTAGEVVREYLTGFVNNASKMSAVAISFLILFALLLISVIEKTLNKIWRVSEKRQLVTSFSMYWMILTLGPILVGGSLAISSYVVSFAALGDIELMGKGSVLLRILPMLASTFAFLILYTIVPNKVVPFKYALAGATVAALLFEIAKKGFALYVTQLPSYQAIYGALATIPILFVWVYISWLVVILGAVFTVSLEEYIEQKKSLTHQVNTPNSL